MDQIFFVFVGVMRVQRVGIEGDVRFGFDGGDDSLLKSDGLGYRVRNCFCFGRPIVAVVRDTHDDFIGRDDLHDSFDIALEPILRSNRARFRRRIVKVVVHQDHGVGFVGQGFVVVTPIRGRERDH